MGSQPIAENSTNELDRMQKCLKQFVMSNVRISTKKNTQLTHTVAK